MSNGTLTQWNRLESRPRKNDFSRTLRAEIRDALWMMTRQWQLGELTAEDTGSPVSAKIFYNSTLLDRLKLGDQDIVELHNDLPLETLVERENIHITTIAGKDFINDISLSTAIRRRLIRYITDAFSTPVKDAILKALRVHPDLQFSVVSDPAGATAFEDVSLIVNSQLHGMHAALASRAFHGGKLYVSLKSGDPLSDYVSNLPPSEKDSLNNLGKQLVAWFDGLFNQTSLDNKAWHPNHLEYQFSTVSPDMSGNAVPLTAEEFTGGRLDWYASDIANDKSEFTQNLRSELNSGENDEVFPAEVAFNGMPHSRWWEMEDGALNFTQVQPNKTDLAKLLFAEFGLLYSNDWYVMPLTLPFGSLTKIERIEIKDTFGQYTITRHYKNHSENENWGLFNLTNAETANKIDSQYLYLPPVAHDLLVSEPVEKVNFIRDEMANMVWGIESLVPDGLGAGGDGNTMAIKIRAYYQNLFPSGENISNNDASITYTLVSEVPENWIPFIPVRIQNGSSQSRQIQLQRAQLPRIVGTLPPMRIEPRTSVLLKEESPYYVFEEEILKSGTIVEMHWQRTRMSDGTNIIWLGRKKTNGRGEGRSTLGYDQLQGNAV